MDDAPSFDPPKGGWFRGKYISKESIEDMFAWCNPSEEYVKMLKLGEPTVARSEDIKEIISEINEDALTADGFDDALIGYTQNSCEPCRAVYDVERCIAILIEGGMTAEEATEYFEFNTLGAYVGENGPVFVSL